MGAEGEMVKEALLETEKPAIHNTLYCVDLLTYKAV